MDEDYGLVGFGGLGYSATTCGDSRRDGSLMVAATSSSAANHTDAGGATAASSVAGDMLKNLMQQCLAYHNEQKQKSTHDDAKAEAASQEQQQSSSGSDPSPTKNKKRDFQQVVEEGRSRANAILEKFQQLTRDHGGQEVSETQTTTTNGVIVPRNAIASTEFRQRRETFFAKENQKKQEFWIKNFDYVARRDSQRLQQQMVQLNAAQQWEHQVQNQYQQVLEQRKKRLLVAAATGGKQQQQQQQSSNNSNLTSQAGIGSAKRKRVEREKNRKGHIPQTRQQQQNDSSTVAVYLSGMPTDGSVPEATLQHLFGSYGTICKIHLYRNKQTGKLKGDALIVYQTKPGEKSQILQNVCSQMNGAELPSGAILQVEPSDSNYNRSNQQQQNKGNDKNARANGTVTTGQQPSVNDDKKGGSKDCKEDDSTGDLDEFFESLE